MQSQQRIILILGLYCIIICENFRQLKMSPSPRIAKKLSFVTVAMVTIAIINRAWDKNNYYTDLRPSIMHTQVIKWSVPFRRESQKN
jgi:hypothetical protein